MGPNVSCTLVYEWDTPINSSSVCKQVVSVTPLYRYRCVSILPKLYITTMCLCTLSALIPGSGARLCVKVLSPTIVLDGPGQSKEIPSYPRRIVYKFLSTWCRV